MSQLNTVALLPMKANSERVRGKNFKMLAGKPLFWWILEELLRVDAIDKIIINTDARSTLQTCGLEDNPRICIRDRKPQLCGDLVSMNRIIEDDLDAVPADRYIMTHTTNPLIRAKTIEAALSNLAQSPENDSLFTVNKVQARFYHADGSTVNHDPTNLIRTQDLEPWFEENSCLYVFSRESFTKTGARIGVSPILMETPPLESLDIDEPYDWEMVTALAEQRLNSKQ